MTWPEAFAQVGSAWADSARLAAFSAMMVGAAWAIAWVQVHRAKWGPGGER